MVKIQSLALGNIIVIRRRISHLSDGQDFDGPSPALLTFPSGSSPGDLQCVVINLMYDNDAEATENLIVELRNNDSAVVVPAGGDIVIINIRDMPNPFGKQ